MFKLTSIFLHLCFASRQIPKDMAHSDTPPSGADPRDVVAIRLRGPDGKLVTTYIDSPHRENDAFLASVREKISELLEDHPEASLISIDRINEIYGKRTVRTSTLKRQGVTDAAISQFDGQVAANQSVREIDDLPE